jgi:hypothetical protein
MQTLQVWQKFMDRNTQGSSFLATLGLMLQSRWDWETK